MPGTLCARWVPHLLTKEQKAYRVKCARELLKTYKNCQNKRINELLTGDETWIFFYLAKNSQQSMDC